MCRASPGTTRPAPGHPLLGSWSAATTRRAVVLGVLGVLGVLAGLQPVAAAPTFSDVPPDQQFHLEITWAADEGIVTGYGDGTFRPSAAVTRQAMAAFLHRFAGSPPVPPRPATFRDVSPAHPFSTEVEWLADEGIAEGYADGTFRPGAAVSRQAMAAYLYRVAGSPPPPADLAAVFTDVSRGHTFFVPIAFLYDFAIADGFNDGSFQPLVAVSRQATAAFLFRLDQRFDEGAFGGDVVGGDATEPWPTPAERSAALPEWVHRG